MQSKDWNTRPSELLAIDDAYVSYCVDEAVGRWGNWVKQQLEEATKNAKNERQRERRLQLKFGQIFTETKEQPGRFRDPAEMLK